MQEIKECPYCGSDNARVYSSVIKGSQVICQDCMMRGPSGYTDSIAKWNSLPRKSDIEELKSYIAQIEEEKSESYKWFDKLAEVCGVVEKTDPGKPETFQVFIDLFERLENENKMLIDGVKELPSIVDANERIKAMSYQLSVEAMLSIKQFEIGLDWLALQLSKLGNSMMNVCPEFEREYPITECLAIHGSCADCWREAAMKIGEQEKEKIIKMVEDYKSKYPNQEITVQEYIEKHSKEEAHD